jgi:hypothetical protein
MGGEKVDPQGKSETPAADRAKDDIVKEKYRHDGGIRIQKWEFSID